MTNYYLLYIYCFPYDQIVFIFQTFISFHCVECLLRYNVLGILNEIYYGFNPFQNTLRNWSTLFFDTQFLRIVLFTTKMINLISTTLMVNVKLHTLISTPDDSLCFYILNRSLIKDDIFRVPTCIYSLHSPVTWWHVLFTQLDWQLSAQLSPKNVSAHSKI